MRLNGSRTYYRPTPPKMPPGLVELMEGLTREVLKNNPTDIYGFCAGHVQHLLEIRDGPLNKKPISLEEKVLRAQQKVRQRAEKRRQLYDKAENVVQQSGNVSVVDTTTTVKDLSPSMPLDISIANSFKSPIHQEQELINSSEVEISHELGKETEKLSNDPLPENIENAFINELNNVEFIEAAKHTRYESENEVDMNELTDQTSTNDSVISTASLNNLLETASNSNEDILKNDEVINGKNLSPISERIVDEHIFNESGSSVTITQDCPPAALGDNSKDLALADTETENPAGNGKTTEDINKTLHELNLHTQTVTGNIDTVADSKNDTLDEAHVESSEMSINIPNTQQLDQINIHSDNNKLFEQIEMESTAEDTKESNTINFCYKESPTTELQGPVIQSDMLVSLPGTDTDSDIATLITQDSNYELKQTDLTKQDSSHIESAITDRDNTESLMTITSDDELHDNASNESNPIDVINVTENNTIANNTNEKHENNNVDEDARPQLSNQNSSMDLETAAITIQKVFRTFLFKSRASTFDDTVTDESMFLDEDDKNKEECEFPIVNTMNIERRPLGLTRMDTVLQTVNEEKSLSLSTEDSSTLSSAATIIQAHVRGFLIRNKLNSNKTASTNSLAASNSNEPSLTSLEMDNDQNKSKTVLNIHIVSEGSNFLSRDESLITSMDLSLDSSPPSSINLHPLGYDKSERRKQLKREDAIQSVSPPSNNSGKLSEDVESVKELPLTDNEVVTQVEQVLDLVKSGSHEAANTDNDMFVSNGTLESIENSNLVVRETNSSKINSDESDVVTPFTNEANETSESESKLMHSGEFHDAVLPTKVARSDTAVVSEFKNVLVYFLLWNNS